MGTRWTQIQVRVAPDDLALIDALASTRGVSRSAVVKHALVRVLAAERAKRAPERVEAQ